MFVIMTATNIYIIIQNDETFTNLDAKQKQTQDIFIMRNAAQQRALMLFQMNAMEDFFERDDMYILFKKEALKFTLAFKRLRESEGESEESAWAGIQELATIGSSTQNMAAELIYIEETKKATNLLKHKAIPVQQKVISGLKKQRDKQQKYLTEQITHIQKLNVNAYWIVLALGIVAVTFGSLIAIFVSRHNKYTSKLELEKKLVEEENLAKREFLANMSHELRTPIHAILSFSKFGIMKKNISEEKNKKYYNNINNSGKRLLGLVNNLLDIEKLESGKFKFNFEEVDIVKLVEEAVVDVSSLIEKKNLTVSNNVAKDFKSVICDKNLVSQLYINL